MYLYAKKEEYTSSFRGNMKDYPEEIAKVAKDVGNQSTTVTTSYLIGYWRKENAIHEWFVEHCGDGVDECQTIHVSREAVEELHSTCLKVLVDHSLAPTLLPTQDGFFFGSTDYDEWYYKGVEYTADLTQRIIDMMNNDTEHVYEIIYEASW